MWKFIALKALKFHSFNLIRTVLEKKIFLNKTRKQENKKFSTLLGNETFPTYKG